MMNKMIVANLVQRPIRSLISIVAIALEVTLILMIVWLSLGMMNDSRTRQEGIGADVIVLPPGSSNIIGMTGAPAPIKIAGHSGKARSREGRFARVDADFLGYGRRSRSAQRD